MMDIKDFLSPADCIADLRAADKMRLLQDLAQRAAMALTLSPDRVTGEVVKREGLGSTGVGQGVAIPHARMQEIKKPFGLLARLKRSIDFDAIDGKPIDLVFLLLLPTAAEGDQLNALACVARKLRDPDALGNLRGAADGAELFRAMTQHVEPKRA
jgi:PTS system nitrogen regulatory IIA component